MKDLVIDDSICPGYRLVDFGDGRKLESVGGRLIDRPSPAAQSFRKRHPNRWRLAQSRFDSNQKSWSHRSDWPATCIDCGLFQMPVTPTPFGHLGIFPEQAANWRWLANQIDVSGDREARPSALNLFAYTGASTIAMATAGLAVAHVDAAKPNVAVARAAAQSNALQDHPIRYLVDDAAKFVAREVRRGNRYQAIVMDPPAYGHSPSGKTWRIERDLWPLIDDCLRIVDPTGFRLLITGHSPQVGPSDVVTYLETHFCDQAHDQSVDSRTQFDAGRMLIVDESDRRLDAGFYVRLIAGRFAATPRQ